MTTQEERERDQLGQKWGSTAGRGSGRKQEESDRMKLESMAEVRSSRGSQTMLKSQVLF